jgi:transcription elongation GreA/GreB family factor
VINNLTVLLNEIDHILSLKTTIHQRCLELIANKRQVLQEALDQATEAANQDSKSSAGDKHETGKAMMQLEQEKLGQQILEIDAKIEQLQKINSTIAHETAKLGTLLTTNHGTFYLSIALGKIEIEGMTCFAISPQSPIGLQMMGKKVGEGFEVSGRVYSIEEVN